MPTARFGVFDSLEDARAFLATLPGPWVVKTDGLAAGKGVLVAAALAEAEADAAAKLSGRAFGSSGRVVVIEEGLSGAEFSLLVLCDGRRVVPLAPAQDFKRVADGDRGPNTGGMGAYSPGARSRRGHGRPADGRGGRAAWWARCGPGGSTTGACSTPG